MTDIVDVGQDHESFEQRTVEGEPMRVAFCLTCGGRWPCLPLRERRVREMDAKHDHGPAEQRDLDGHIRCEACGYRWPCPTAHRENLALTPDERTLLELVEPGWRVYKRVPGGERPGGIVVGHRELVNLLDDSVERAYTVLDFRHGKPREFELRASELDPMDTALPDAGAIRDAWRRVCRSISDQRGPSDDREIRAVEIAFTLTRIAAGGIT